MAAFLATARSFGPTIIDISAPGTPLLVRRRKVACRWRIDSETGKLVCDWDDDPLPRQFVLHLRLVKA